jgi:hypothetical protein
MDARDRRRAFCTCSTVIGLYSSSEMEWGGCGDAHLSAPGIPDPGISGPGAPDSGGLNAADTLEASSTASSNELEESVTLNRCSVTSTGNQCKVSLYNKQAMGRVPE